MFAFASRAAGASNQVPGEGDLKIGDLVFVWGAVLPGLKELLKPRAPMGHCEPDGRFAEP